MSPFPSRPLSEISSIFSGYAFKSNDMTPDGDIPIIKIANIQDRLVTSACVTSISKQLFNEKLEKYILKPDDVLIAMTGAGSVGNIGKMRRVERTFLVNQRVGIIRINSKLADPEYVYQVLSNPEVENKYYQLGLGAGQPNLSPTMIGSHQIPFPPLPTQRRIADILSAYDDLIENNTRRIRILEGMAQAIYQEWFGKVDKESLPKGWELKTIGDVLESLESGSRPKGGIDPNERGVPSIGAENIIGLGQYNFASEKFVSRDFYNAMTKGYIKSKDVLLYKDGAQIGRKTMFRDGFPHEECCINEHVFILRTNESCTQNYLFFWLDQPDMTQNIRNLNANAAQPGINQTGVKGLPILLPDRKSLEKYDEVVDPILALLFNLAKKNINLRQTRDLLLPRLVSGEIELQWAA